MDALVAQLSKLLSFRNLRQRWPLRSKTKIESWATGKSNKVKLFSTHLKEQPNETIACFDNSHLPAFGK